MEVEIIQRYHSWDIQQMEWNFTANGVNVDSDQVGATFAAVDTSGVTLRFL